jgi:hypothetical protein
MFIAADHVIDDAGGVYHALKGSMGWEQKLW